MLRKFIPITLVVALAVSLVSLEYNLATNLFTSTEELYPVELAVGMVVPAATVPEITPEPLPVLRANPFVPVRELRPTVPTVAPPQTAKTFDPAKLLLARGITLNAFTDSVDGVDSGELEHCQALVEQTLQVLPGRLTASLNDLTLFFSNRNPRGLSNSHVLELRCAGLSDTEVVSVLVHELGHVSDLGGLRGTSTTPSGFTDGRIVIAADDPSAAFYALSWTDEKTKKSGAKRLDFVSGYAMSDVFEDFAESFDYYTLHGADFRLLAGDSKTLQAKYDFFRDVVFAGVEYDSTLTAKTGKRVWDTTLVEYDLAGFLGDGMNIASR